MTNSQEQEVDFTLNLSKNSYLAIEGRAHFIKRTQISKGTSPNSTRNSLLEMRMLINA